MKMFMERLDANDAPSKDAGKQETSVGCRSLDACFFHQRNVLVGNVIAASSPVTSNGRVSTT